jgi:hypothetical protein
VDVFLPNLLAALKRQLKKQAGRSSAAAISSMAVAGKGEAGPGTGVFCVLCYVCDLSLGTTNDLDLAGEGSVGYQALQCRERCRCTDGVHVTKETCIVTVCCVC